MLIVEDHPNGAESLALLVRLYGHVTRVARTGAEAVASAAADPPDVVLMDIGLPGEDGYATARRVREAAGRRPLLVAVTGYMHLDGRSREEGFDHHLVKPADPVVLAGVLQAHAERLAAAPPPG